MSRPQQQAPATRVLLVEDNPGDADLVALALGEAEAFSDVLRHAGYAALPAACGRIPAIDAVFG